MKKIGTVLIILVILVAIAFGIYSILPETQHNYFYSKYQMKFDSNAKAKVQEVQAWVNPNLNTDYKSILEANTGNKAWVYKEDKAAGTQTVTYYGSKCNLVLKEIPDHDDRLYSEANIKVEFVTDSEGNKSVNVYLSGESEAADEVTKPYIFEQLLNGTAND